MSYTRIKMIYPLISPLPDAYDQSRDPVEPAEAGVAGSELNGLDSYMESRRESALEEAQE